MNPPAPARTSAATALLTDGRAASSGPTAAHSNAPYASAPWSPSTRGWLVPTAAQAANATLPAERSQALALATNRAANSLVLHAQRDATFTAAVRAPAKVVDEEVYLDDLTAIIRRDFYPALDAMEHKLAMHTPAWDGKMTGAATAARRGAAAAHAADTPGATPLTAAALQLRGPSSHRRRRRSRAEGAGEGEGSSFEDDEDEVPMLERPGSPGRLEPGEHAAAAASSSARPAASSTVLIARPSSSAAAVAAASASAAAAAAAVRLHPKELRLGSYLELHTSEDNASFEVIQNKRAKHLDERMHWANAEFEQKVNDTRIVLSDDAARDGNVSGWKYAVRNKLFFYPDHGARSELAIDAYDASQTPAQQIANAVARKSASIEYENTRFPGALTNPFPGQNRSSNDQAGQAATPAAAASSSGAGRTPAVGGYKLLRTPSPAPGAGGPGAQSPLITWGQLLATPSHLHEEDADGVGPLQLDPADLAAAAASNTGFKIAPTPRRDEVAWGMVDSARRKEFEAKKRKRADATPVPLFSSALLASPAIGLATPAAAAAATPSRAQPSSSSSRRPPQSPAPASGTPMMSPAAQRLMAQTMRAAGRSSTSSSARSARPAAVAALSGVDMQLRASYSSPSPAQLSHGKSGGSSRPATSQRATPRVPLFTSSPLTRAH